MVTYCNNVYTCIKLDKYTTCNADIETLCVSLDLKDHMKIVKLNLYRPPAGSIPAALDQLSDLIELILSDLRHIDLYIVGDFNLDISRCNPNTKRLAEICATNNLFNLINIPTRFTDKCATILDLCITNCNVVNISGTIVYGISDHLMTFSIKKRMRNNRGNLRCSVNIRSYKNYDAENMGISLQSYNWGKFYATKDVEMAWSILCDQILLHANFYAPYKSVTMLVSQPPWFTTELLEHSIERDRLLNSAIRSGDKNKFKIAHRKRNEVKTLIHNARSDYYQQQIKQN